MRKIRSCFSRVQQNNKNTKKEKKANKQTDKQKQKIARKTDETTTLDTKTSERKKKTHIFY